MTSTKELLTEFHKDYGEKVGGLGNEFVQVDRIPTGFFEFDMASGGGIPRGRTTILFGPESSGKTNMALRLIAAHQVMYPDHTCAFFDVENSFNPDWARLMGVDVDKLLVFKPDYAEQIVDMAEGLLHAEDCGVVVVDSVAAMVTTQEISSSAEKANVGGSGLVMGKLIRKTTRAMSEAEKAGHTPTLILINQVRFKIGIVYGNPETIPGGNAQKFASSMTVRLYGTNIVDEKVSKTMPCRKKIKAVIQKWKVPIAATVAEFEVVMMPHKGLAVGTCNDWGTITKKMENHGLFGKTKNGKAWFMVDVDGVVHEYKTIKSCKEVFYADDALSTMVKKALIEKELDDAHGGAV